MNLAIQWAETGVDLEGAKERAAAIDPPSAQLDTAARAKAFILAGNARFTLVSKKTGTRFTYRVRAKEGTDLFFVSLLNGSDNESDYQFLGTIFGGRTYAHGRKSRIGQAAPSAKAMAWALPKLLAGVLPEGVEVHHEGRCGRCGRALTVPESIRLGLGPECAGKGGA